MMPTKTPMSVGERSRSLAIIGASTDVAVAASDVNIWIASVTTSAVAAARRRDADDGSFWLASSIYLATCDAGTIVSDAAVKARATSIGTCIWYHANMKRKHQRTLAAIFVHPVSANLQWRDIEALFQELGAEISEREGSRVAVVLFNEVRVFHRPHPSPATDKGAVASIRKWLEQHGVAP